VNFLSILKRNLIYKLKSKKNIDIDFFEDNTALDNLFEFYKTDKANNLKDNDLSGHGYSNFYDNHFKKFKSKQINLLEIGSYSGASAAAFSKYFKNINIFCLDINLSKFKFKSKNIHPFCIDANNQKMVSKFFKKVNFFQSIKEFDIIIDDGSHILSDQLKSLNFFFKYVKFGGYYVIEEYRFPEYFSHLRDTNECTINDLVENIKMKKDFNNKFLENSIIESLSRNISSIYKYKGNTKHSDILFIQKNN